LCLSRSTVAINADLGITCAGMQFAAAGILLAGAQALQSRPAIMRQYLMAQFGDSLSWEQACAGVQFNPDGTLSANAQATQPRAAGVQCYLVAQLSGSLAWELRHVMCSCSASLLPLKVCLATHTWSVKGGTQSCSVMSSATFPTIDAL
jgi:hypothetical protein